MLIKRIAVIIFFSVRRGKHYGALRNRNLAVVQFKYLGIRLIIVGNILEYVIEFILLRAFIYSLNAAAAGKAERISGGKRVYAVNRRKLLAVHCYHIFLIRMNKSIINPALSTGGNGKLQSAGCNRERAFLLCYIIVGSKSALCQFIFNCIFHAAYIGNAADCLYGIRLDILSDKSVRTRYARLGKRTSVVGLRIAAGYKRYIPGVDRQRSVEVINIIRYAIIGSGAIAAYASSIGSRIRAGAARKRKCVAVFFFKSGKGKRFGGFSNRYRNARKRFARSLIGIFRIIQLHRHGAVLYPCTGKFYIVCGHAEAAAQYRYIIRRPAAEGIAFKGRSFCNRNRSADIAILIFGQRRRTFNRIVVGVANRKFFVYVVDIQIYRGVRVAFRKQLDGRIVVANHIIFHIKCINLGHNRAANANRTDVLCQLRIFRKFF